MLEYEGEGHGLMRDLKYDLSDIQEGDPLEVEASAEGRVELRRASKIPTLTQLVTQITPQNRYDEISTGADVGKEALER